MDDAGHDEVMQDGTHRVVHQLETKELAPTKQVPATRNSEISESRHRHEEKPMKEVNYNYRTVKPENKSTHWGNRADEMEGVPGQVRQEQSGSFGHDTSKAPGRMQQIREKLQPYGERLKSDVTGSIKQAPTRLKESTVRHAKEAVRYADERTDAGISGFGFDPVKQVRQEREVRRRSHEKRMTIQEERAEGVRQVPVEKVSHKKQPAMGMGFLFSEGFAPTPTIFASIHGSRATGRKRKRDGLGPGDLLL